MVSTASTDLFRGRLSLIWIRGMVVILTIPVIIIAIRSPSILQIFFMSNLVASAAVPPFFLGLSNKFYFLQGFEVICGALGGIFGVWVFGVIFYNGDAKAAAQLLRLQSLYAEDWSVFGAFLTAPVAALLTCYAACALRLGVRWVICKRNGVKFDGLDKPVELPAAAAAGPDPDDTAKAC